MFVFRILRMGGMPPFIGFFLKVWVFGLVLYGVGYGVLFFIIMISAIMFYIYFRIVYDLIIGSFKRGGWLVSEGSGGGWDSIVGTRLIFGVVVRGLL